MVLSIFEVIETPSALLNGLDGAITKIGLILLFLGLVDAGISVNWAQVGGIQTLVIPLKTAAIVVVGIGLIAFGITLQA